MLSFVQRYGADEIHLDRNYRSTQKILDVANRVISKAYDSWEGRVLKLWTEAPEGEDVEAEIYPNGLEEVGHITKRISNLVRDGYRYSDIALLMRMSFLSRGVEKEFMAKGIPFEVVRGLAFYERAEVKDLLAYLRFLSNVADRAAFERIINIPKRGIGRKALSIIRGNFRESWIQALCDSSFPPRLRARAECFVNLALKYRDQVDVQPCETVKGLIKDIGYEEYLGDAYKEDYEDRLQNVSELINVLRELETLGKTLKEFTEDLCLSSEQDAIGSDDKVKLMTVHAAKGLEFPVVFLIGLEEEIFPAAKALHNPRALEEERRLCYVAVSRAQERLFLSAARERMRFGSYVYLEASRFIEEVTGNYGGATSCPSRKRI